jgi:hypothetical protein
MGEAKKIGEAIRPNRFAGVMDGYRILSSGSKS